ncbi:hypothetical protein CgunFtcFv8_006268 [Champsocephalus gunnari]|nr:hypothetical protein CgunFtcFv8_006268 [Champsocephalus gunnari]
MEILPWATHRNIMSEEEVSLTAGSTSRAVTATCWLSFPLQISGLYKLPFPLPTKLLVVLGSTSITSHGPVIEVKIRNLSVEQARGRDVVVGRAAFPEPHSSPPEDTSVGNQSLELGEDGGIVLSSPPDLRLWIYKRLL